MALLRTNTEMEDEKTPLAEANNFNSKYESINEENNTLVYCLHGKPSQECCGNSLEQRSRSNSHCHPVNDQKKDDSARKRLIAASILCLAFMIGEIVGGYLANSLAIMTDAAHLLTDFASFMISLFSIWMASRPATKKMSFGWYRAEVIGALTSVIMIWVVTGILIFLAIERIVKGKYEIEAGIMLITSAVGVAVNIIMGASLYFGGVSHGHSHGNSNVEHGHSHNGSDKQANINVRAAFIHVLGDLVQSLGVLVAATVIYFKPSFGIVDPICTFLFSALVLFTTYNIVKDALHVLMEGIPRGFDFNEVRATLQSVPGVIEIHNLRIWSLTLDKVAMSVHLAIDSQLAPKTVLKEASSRIRAKYSIFELTIQVEDYNDFMKKCGECQKLND